MVMTTVNLMLKHVGSCNNPGQKRYVHSFGQFHNNNNNNNRRLVTLAEHTSDHGRQTNSSTEEKGEQV